jgi:AraC-like DNA-binding protein
MNVTGGHASSLARRPPALLHAIDVKNVQAARRDAMLPSRPMPEVIPQHRRADPARIEHTRWHYSPALGGLERIEGTVGASEFPRHSHRTYALGLVERGVNRNYFRGAWHDVAPGMICTVTPGETHAGVAAGGAGFTYRCLYPTAAQLDAARGVDPDGAPRGMLLLPAAIEDAELAASLRRLFAAVARSAPLLEEEALLAGCLARAARHGRGRPVHAACSPPARRAVAQARELLAARLVDPPALAELAAAVGMHPFALLRQFQRIVGLPPHAFVVQLRVERARDLLRAGRSPASVAAALGFADQAHLTRQFKQRIGVPPGAYARAFRTSRSRDR